MNILSISNHSDLRCGVGEFGRQMTTALRALGHDVIDFDGAYPTVYAHGYLPSADVLAAADIVHFNWQPATLNHYQPDHIRAIRAVSQAAISVFLHDLPPWSSCAIADFANVKSALEPYEDYVVIPPPCLAYVPQQTLSPYPTIGRTGIGDAGLAVLDDIVRRRGWVLSNSSEEWVSNEAEIDRLAKCWVNVVWYNYNRSRSSAASIVATARRPTLLSECSRFDHLLPWAEEFYWVEGAVSGQALEEALVKMVEKVTFRKPLRVPEKSVEGLQWGKVLPKLIAAWERACR